MCKALPPCTIMIAVFARRVWTLTTTREVPVVHSQRSATERQRPLPQEAGAHDVEVLAIAVVRRWLGDRSQLRRQPAHLGESTGSF